MTALTPGRERPGWLVWLAGGAVVLAVGAVGLAVVQPFAVGPVGFDSAASVAFFDRIVGGQRLEAYVGATPKPLLTLVYGLLYDVTHDWRAISWATIGAFAVGTYLAARLVQRLAGLPAAVFAVIGLVGLSLLQSDLILAYATPWAMVGWFAAGLLVTGPRPRFGLAGIALMLAALARLETPRSRGLRPHRTRGVLGLASFRKARRSRPSDRPGPGTPHDAEPWTSAGRLASRAWLRGGGRHARS